MAAIARRGENKYTVICYIDGTQKWSTGMIVQKAKMLKRFLDNIDDVDKTTYQIAYDTIVSISDFVIKEKGISYNDYCKMVSEKLNDQYSGDKLTVEEFFWEFAERYGKVKWGSSYYKSNISNMKHYVFPYLGDKLINEIKVKDIDQHYMFLVTDCKPAMCKYRKPLERVTPSLVLDVHKTLRCMFNQAVKWEYIPSNPFLKATLPEHTTKERESLSPSELKKLLKYLDDENDYQKFVFYCAILLDFACTTRSGEVSALQWPDFSPERKEVQIYKSLGKVEKQHLDLPKSKIYFTFPVSYPGCKSVSVLQKTKTGNERTAYLPNLVVQKLLVLKDQQDKYKELLGDEYVDYGLIICQSNGRPMTSDYLNKGMKKYLDKLGMKEVVFHSIRSTSATYKLRLSGGDIKSVQGEGGWSDPKMVTKQYSRILEEDRRGLSDKMDNEDFFKGASQKHTKEKSQETTTPEMQQLLTIAETNPELLKKLFDSVKVLT